ncbi:MAG: hypothetical protein P8N51_17400 [Pseudomonadales bacterium]|nr:hypothetical protein [Pseudomonadales bacterium]
MKSTHLFIGLTLALLSSPAMAYIDPGSGSAIMSAVIGFFVAVGIAVKTYWYKIKSLFGVQKKQRIDEKNKQEDEQDS